MEQRMLGRTGVSVSNLCLGTMMFGDWGTKDHDESIRIIHRALDAAAESLEPSTSRWDPTSGATVTPRPATGVIDQSAFDVWVGADSTAQLTTAFDVTP